jgi:hypothetical protein
MRNALDAARVLLFVPQKHFKQKITTTFDISTITTHNALAAEPVFYTALNRQRRSIMRSA